MFSLAKLDFSFKLLVSFWPDKTPILNEGRKEEIKKKQYRFCP